MRKSLLLVSLVLSMHSGAADANDVVMNVGPFQRGFVLRGDEIVREVGPGLNYRLPFIERWALVETLYERENRFDVTAPLSDGEACTVSLRVVYNIINARKALEWRLENDPDVPTRGTIMPNREVYGEPERVVREQLTTTMKGISSDEAREGAIENAFRDPDLRPRELGDGTQVWRTTHEAISCSEWKPPAHSKCPVVLGDAQPFERQDKWSIASGGMDTFIAKPDDLIILHIDGKRVRLTSPTVTFSIVDPTAFEKRVSSNKIRASHRASKLIADATGMVAGSMESGDLPSLYGDLFEGGLPDHVREQLSKMGLRIVGADFSEAAYRVSMRDPACVAAE